MNNPVLSTYDNIELIGVAAATSTKWRSLDDVIRDPLISQQIDEKFDLVKFKKSTGVLGRYDAGSKQTTSDFCFAAANELIQTLNIDKDKIGVLILVTQFPDYTLPATACILHNRLGLSNGCLAFDVNLGCSGYIYGLNIISSLLNSSDAKYGLLLCGDTSAKNKYRDKCENRNTHSTLLLFGDGGSATLIEKKRDTSNPIIFYSCTDGSGYDAIIMPEKSWRHPFLEIPRYIDDMRVFNFSIDEVPKMIKNYMNIVKSNPNDYDGLVLHQANKFIIQTISKRTGFSNEKVFMSIEKFANTSSASIPITLVDHYKDNNNAINKLLCCGFGVGLSWATVELNINTSNILPLVQTDEWFDDGF